MAGINADAHPALVLHPVDNIGDLLERVAEIRSLSRRVLDHRRHAAGLIQRQVDRLRDQRQTFLVADLLQRTAGGENSADPTPTARSAASRRGKPPATSPAHPHPGYRD